MIVTKFRLFESNESDSELIGKLLEEWKKVEDNGKDEVLRKIKRAAMKSTNLKPWFDKFRAQRTVMVELKKIKYKN